MFSTWLPALLCCPLVNHAGWYPDLKAHCLWAQFPWAGPTYLPLRVIQWSEGGWQSFSALVVKGSSERFCD